MILAARHVQRPRFTGANVLILRDAMAAGEALSLAVFASFDEALERVRTDADATRIGVEPGPGSDFTTAGESARRSLPDRVRPGASLYWAGVATTSAGSTLWTNAPAWIRFWFETSKGELFEAPPASNASAGAPRSHALRPDDLYVHMTLFAGADKLPRLTPSTAPFVRRLSRLVEESNENDWPVTLSFPVKATEDIP